MEQANMGEEDPFAPFTATVSFQRFMDLTRNDSAKEFVRKINRFLQKFNSTKRGAQSDTTALQSFLEKIEGEFKKHKVWKNIPAHELSIMMEGVEKYLTTKLYSYLFGKYPEDRERDRVLSERMMALQFVQPKHLDIPPSVITEDALLLATAELQKMNNYRCPRDKLVCILNCCRVISNLLKSAGKAGDGADIFVPVMNYVVIRAQPEKLMSNIEFIRRFRMQSRLVSLAEYYFMQLSVSALFIETANAESFTGARQLFLDSFMERGLISKGQYQEAINGFEDCVNGDLTFKTKASEPEQQKYQFTKPFARPPVPRSTKSDEPPFLSRAEHDTSSIVSSVLSIPRSTQGANEVSWDRISSFSELEAEGTALAAQYTAEGEMVKKYPMMTATIDNLALGQIETLVLDYRWLVLSYEVLKEATMHKDSSTIIKLLEESNEGRQWKSVWPSKMDLLPKYPFLSVQSSNLTFGDVSKLLTSYKELVLQYEILELALRRRIRPANWSAGDSTILHDLETDSTVMDQDWQENQIMFPSRENSGSSTKAAVQEQPDQLGESEIQRREAQRAGHSQEAPSTAEGAGCRTGELIDLGSIDETSTKTGSIPVTADDSVSLQASQKVEWDEGPSNGHLISGNANENGTATDKLVLSSGKVFSTLETSEIKGTMQESLTDVAKETAVANSGPEAEFIFSNGVQDSSVSLNISSNNEDPPTPTFQHTESLIDL